LKPERWGSPLVQEKYQEEKACDKRHPYRIIIIIIIIIITGYCLLVCSYFTKNMVLTQRSVVIRKKFLLT